MYGYYGSQNLGIAKDAENRLHMSPAVEALAEVSRALSTVSSRG